MAVLRTFAVALIVGTILFFSGCRTDVTIHDDDAEVQPSRQASPTDSDYDRDRSRD